MTMEWMITRRFAKIVAGWMIVSAALLGVVASCGDSEGGMYQGPNDSEPGWRR